VYATEERFRIRAQRSGLAALAGTGLLLIAALLHPHHTGAYPLSGCQLTLISYDAAGVQIDQAIGGAADATPQDPLQVAWDGSIRWARSDSARAGGGSWHVDVYGLPTMLRSDDSSTADGTLRIRETMSFRFSGLFFVSGQLAGEEPCSGSGWIRLVGDPTTTLPFTLSMALLLVGLVLLAVAARGGRWPAAIFGGLMLGLASAVLLVSYALLPLAQSTPYLALVAGVLVGLAAGGYGSFQSRRTPG
jgi:hypothetical protein